MKLLNKGQQTLNLIFKGINLTYSYDVTLNIQNILTQQNSVSSVSVISFLGFYYDLEPAGTNVWQLLVNAEAQLTVLLGKTEKQQVAPQHLDETRTLCQSKKTYTHKSGGINHSRDVPHLSGSTSFSADSGE